MARSNLHVYYLQLYKIDKCLSHDVTTTEPIDFKPVLIVTNANYCLNAKLQDLIVEFKSQLPYQEGLLLNPHATMQRT